MPLPLPLPLPPGKGLLAGPRRPLTLALSAALALSACGYRVGSAWRGPGGVERVHVAAFENRSAEPQLGAEVTAALRNELARRGASGDAGSAARLEGEVRALPGAPSTAGAATWRAGLEVRARLVVDGRAVAERTVRREGDHLGGADALETEGRRAVALARLAEEAARELVRELEGP